MQKIVINKVFGGFSLSPRAVQRLAELHGQPCFFFSSEDHTRTSLSVEEAANEFSWQAYTVPNPNEVAGSQEHWVSQSLQERIASNKRWDEISIDIRPDDRADPLLVQTVEELGEAANGAHAELKIVEIPDGTKWEIDEYDGMESIHEVHQSWS